MTYRVTVEQYPTYLHIIGTGSNTAANARQFLFDAYRAAVERNCSSILVDMRFSGPSLDLGSIYSVIAERSGDGSNLDRIAYVEANPNHRFEAAEFAELVAQNRGVNVRLFQNVDDAARWLQDGATNKNADPPHC